MFKKHVELIRKTCFNSRMLTQEALDLFGGRVRPLAEALGLSVQAIYAWGEEVPPLRAYQIRDILADRAKVNPVATAPQEREAA